MRMKQKPLDIAHDLVMRCAGCNWQAGRRRKAIEEFLAHEQAAVDEESTRKAIGRAYDIIEDMLGPALCAGATDESEIGVIRNARS